VRHTIAGTTLTVVGVAAATTLEVANRMNDAIGAWIGAVIIVGVVFMFIGVRR
jgi:hypothetical protein